jgi:nicotinate dehydrogenase subunit B
MHFVKEKLQAMEKINQIHSIETTTDEEIISVKPSKHAVTRRNFFRLMGGGVAIILTWRDLLASPAKLNAALDEKMIGAWIHIKEDNTIAVFTGKVEVGQNIRTSLAQVVAEELGVSMEQMELVMGDTLLTPYDRGTFGSRTTPYMGPQLRKAAASLKASLTDMAATHWKTNAADITLKAGVFTNKKNNQTISMGALSKGKQLLVPINEKISLTPVSEWKIAGTSVPKVNGTSFVTGKHQYVSDMVMPGMVYGKILRAPSMGATLVSADVSKVPQTDGIQLVQDGSFIGITASTPQAAANALLKINAKWKFDPLPSNENIFPYLKEKSGFNQTVLKGVKGTNISSAGLSINQSFEVQYIAHVPLEPRAALAFWKGSDLTVYTGTQRPFGVQEELAAVFKISKDKIRVIMPDTGSAYGGKHSGEAAIEAAKLAKAIGKPVKLVWTREEEFNWAYLRPAALIEASVSTSSDGTIQHWNFHNFNSGNAGLELMYEAKNKDIKFHQSDSPFNQGSYRALASTANIFAIESLMDDIAIGLKKDPLAYRLSQLKDERMKTVLQAAADKFGWQKPKAANHGYGIAAGFVKNSYIATCAEVVYNPTTEELKVLRLVSAYDCGTIINPKHLESQVLGCILQGLGGALFEAIDFKDGRILNPVLSSYRVPRFSDIPAIEIELLNRPDIEPAGAGETSIVGVAPAIRNAILNATGIGLYALPLVRNGLKK